MKNFKEFLFEHDNTLNVKDSYKVSDNKDVGEYLYGRCHIFAITLHEQLGLPIEIIIDEEPWHETMGLPSLEHAYCVINDDYVIDARGIRTKQEIMNEYGENANKVVVITDCLSLLKEWINNKILIPTKAKEIEDIKNYINLLKEHKVLAIAPDDYNDTSLEDHLVSIFPEIKNSNRMK